jgi:hypothetical protein
MSYTDKSSLTQTKRVRNRTLAAFHKLNPGGRETNTNTTMGDTFYVGRVEGQITSYCCSEPACVPGTIRNFIASDFLSPCPPPYESYNMYYELSWDAVSGATSYTVTSDFGVDLVVSTGPTSANVYIGNDYSLRTFTLTAITNCGVVRATTTAAPCFLAGSVVQMANGTTKFIEDVLVGDALFGAFGEINVVLALHRPLLGLNLMCNINGEHSTTNHHPHISADKKFYCGDPALVHASTYGRSHEVINGDGIKEQRMLHGLKKERIDKIHIGLDLKTVEGSRRVETLETFSLPADTQLYNLVMSGSHTYHVDGYAVTGWPREDDFNYDTWTKGGA